jgi:hypothetical protein
MANPFRTGMAGSQPVPAPKPKVPSAFTLDQKKTDVPKQPAAVKQGEAKRIDAGKVKYVCVKCGYGFTLMPQNFKKVDCPWCGAVQPKQ